MVTEVLITKIILFLYIYPESSGSVYFINVQKLLFAIKKIMNEFDTKKRKPLLTKSFRVKFVGVRTRKIHYFACATSLHELSKIVDIIAFYRTINFICAFALHNKGVQKVCNRKKLVYLLVNIIMIFILRITLIK